MKRPNLKRLAYMLGVYSNKTIPQTYINEMSDYELLLAILDKINAIIDRCNTYDEVMNEIIEYLNTLDEEVIAEVTRILDEWYASGKFDEAIQAIIDDKFFDTIDNATSKHSVLDFERVFRVLKETNNYQYTQTDLTNPADDDRTPKYTFAQGGCRYYKNGSAYNVNIYIANDGNQFDKNNMGLIEVTNYNGTSVVNSKTFVTTDIGHGQCICHHGDRFYFAGKLDGTPDPDPNFRHKIRWINDDLSGSTYGTILSNFAYVNGIAEYNNEVYVTSALSSEISVAKLQFDEDGYTVQDTVTNILTMSPMNIPSPHGGNRSDTYFSGGFSVTKDFYYFGTYTPNGILKCKRNFDTDGNEIAFTPYWWYSLPDNLDCGEFRAGELEALTVFDNGDCFIYTSQHLNTKALTCHDIMQCFKQNLINNTALGSSPRAEFTGRCNIYVARTNVSSYVDDGETIPITHTNNPHGVNYNDSFATIDEAIWWFNNNEKYNYGYFHMQGNMPHIMFCINGKDYYFDGDANTNSRLHDGNYYTSCGNLVQFGGNVILSSCICHSSIHYWANQNNYRTIKRHPIYCADGSITIANSGSGWDNNPNITGAMSFVHMIGNYNWSHGSYVTQSDFVSANPTKYWANTQTSTINWHNDVSKTGNGTQDIAGNNSLYLNE